MAIEITGGVYEPKGIKNDLIPVDPSMNHRFTYFHTGLGWFFLAGTGKGKSRKPGEWLPRLNQMTMQKGCNGVTATSDKTAVATHLSKGHTVLPVGDPRLGKFARYIATWKNAGGGLTWSTIWQQPRISPLGGLSWVRNDKGYNEFLTFLRDNVLPAMSLEAMEFFVSNKESRAQRLAKFTDKPVYKARYDATLADIVEMREAWERQFSERVEAPVWNELPDPRREVVEE